MLQILIFGDLMRKFISATLLFAVALLWSCTEECDEPDIQKINALYFELQQGGEDGFTEAELDSVYIVRFVPYSEPLVADTTYLYGLYPEGEGRFFINDDFPFLNYQSPYFPTYGYMVVEPTTGFVATIDNIELKGEYDGDCDYRNLEKRFTYNGEAHDYGGSQAYFPITR